MSPTYENKPKISEQIKNAKKKKKKKIVQIKGIDGLRQSVELTVVDIFIVRLLISNCGVST
jgi:hypothetical protein